MRLLEFEGKAILARHGIQVPRGWLVPDLPEEVAGDLVVKAQTLSGGRAKRGGIRTASGSAEAIEAARLLGDRLADGEAVEAVLIEEAIPAAEELYAAALIDRDTGAIQLLVGRKGGVDVESRPELVERLRIAPELGRDDDLAGLVARLHLPGPLARSVTRALAALWETLVAEDAELVEVNPLIATPAGELVAADARLVLDDDAMSRHPERRLRSAALGRTEFERAAAGLGVVGVELAGEICFFSNGAGLTMATLDQLVAGGGRVAAMIELHGVIAHGPGRIADVLELLASLAPRAILVNVFYQFRSTSTIAEGLELAIEARRRQGAPPLPLVVRIRGVDAEPSSRRLANLGVIAVQGFEAACTAALRVAAG